MSTKLLKWDFLINSYKNYLTIEKRLSENSIDNYMRDITKVKNYFLQNYPKSSPSNMNSEEISEFLYNTVKEGYSERTQARFISTIKSCCKFLVNENYRKENPAELLEPPRISRKSRDVLQVEEITDMIESISLNTEEGSRDRAMIEILYSCGLRVSELINLRVSDVHFEEDFLSVVGKGNKKRLIPINLECKRLLKDYFENIRSKLSPKKGHEDYCFLNRRGQKLSRVLIFTLVKKLGNNTRLRKNISPHTFRHSFATHLLSNGAEVRAVQQMLGHESISTTEIYAHNSIDHLRDTISKYLPRR